MPKQPEDLVIRSLRDIQRTLAEHTRKFEAVDRRFEAVDQRFDAIEQRLDDMDGAIIAALGHAVRANTRQDGSDRRLHDLETRVVRLERRR